MGAWGGRGTGAVGRRDPCPAIPSPSRRWVGLEGQGETLAMPTTEPLALPAPVWRPVHPVRYRWGLATPRGGPGQSGPSG